MAVLPLAGLTTVAYAQASDQDTPSQQELAERWNTDYYQATHMSPAQHKAWLQAYENSGSATQAPAPVPPTEPNGQPTWLVVSLGGWRRRWRWWLDWPCWPPGVRTAGLGSGTRPNDRHGHTLDGAAAPTRQPHHLAGDEVGGIPCRRPWHP